MSRIQCMKCLFLAFALVNPLALGAGPLSPPDPPASTMKTIDEAAPGFPITRADIPLTITEPGLYYFTEDLIVPAGVDEGIRVEASNVTIDLRGFTLWGPGKDNPLGYCTGIRVTGLPDARNTRVVNGTVDGFNGNGVSLRFYSSIEGIRVRNVRDTALFADLGSMIRNCIISDSGSDLPSSRMIVGNSVTVEDNIISHCSAYRYFIRTSGGTVRRNRIQTCTMLYAGPAEEDLGSVDLEDIPGVIHGATIVEDNIIIDPLVASDSRWWSAISILGDDQVKGNRVEMARRGRVVGILARPLGNLTPVVEDNVIRSYPNTAVDLQIGIWSHPAGARITGNDVEMARSGSLSTKRQDGILLMGPKSLVANNNITVDRRVDSHAGIRVTTGRNVLTGNRITSLNVTSFDILRALSFEGAGSSAFSSNYYGGNIMEGEVFEEAGGGSNNINGTTPAPNVLY